MTLPYLLSLDTVFIMSNVITQILIQNIKTKGKIKRLSTEYIYRPNGKLVKVFATGPGDSGSISGCGIPQT